MFVLGDVVYRLNRQTGETYKLAGDKWVPIEV